MELRDQVIVITGGGSGIGEGFARRAAAEGARHIVVTDLKGDQAARVAADIGATASAVEVNVADEDAIRRVTSDTIAAHGHIDLFFSNAGYGHRGGMELPNDAFQRMWEVHVMAHIYAARAVLPSMIERKSGYLLNTASAAGLLTQMDSAPYALTKHAAVALAEWLAINHHHQGIRVSVLCPQAVNTNIFAGLDGAGRPDNSQPGGQAGGDGMIEPHDVAEACVQALRAEAFWVLPHPEVATYVQRKATDVDRWLGGMRRYANSLWGETGLPGDWLVD
jgi:NAD(P)-dependent dehydrogenase (short-subunit alcohol dehydrogenase family)